MWVDRLILWRQLSARKDEILENAAIRNIVFKRIGGRELKLDLYLPASAGTLSPLVVWVGGGGWVQMGKGGVNVWLPG